MSESSFPILPSSWKTSATSSQGPDFQRVQYGKLETEESLSDEDETLPRSSMWQRRPVIGNKTLLFTCFVSWAMSISLLVAAVCIRMTPPGSRTGSQRLTYSPIEDAVEFETKVYTAGLGKQLTIYQGSGPEADQAWNDLYDFGPIVIPESQAQLLPNYTEPLKKDQYVIIPAVFHQLHCLNMIRKALDPEHYPSLAPATNADGTSGDRVHDHLLGHAHTSHCIDSIRQTLMCGADISPLVWRKDDEGKLRPEARVVHTCVNFDRIWEWSDEHQLRSGEYDESLFVSGTEPIA